jgi:tetratricopeptide (TPR) repeat protein
LGQLVDILALVNDDPDHARAICTEALRADPDDAQCLFIMALLFARAERFGEAIPLLEKVTRLKPSKAGAWNNLGMCYQECGRLKQAQAAFKKAIDLAPSPDYYANLGAAYNAECNYPEGKRWCRKALDIEPHHATAHATMGFCDLAQGNWADGWRGYDYSLGGRFRKEVKLGNEPRWDGEYVENLFVYGEQGIGDEIMYASCLEDARAKAANVTVECDPRLAGLFARSFPERRSTRYSSSRPRMGCGSDV